MAATTMSSVLAFAVLIVILCAAAASASSSSAGDDLVSQACRNATRHFCRLRLSKDSCVSALRSDERSAAARDLSDLALVALDLVRASAVAADAAVGAAAANGGGADAARSLQYCRVEYDGMARTVPECRRMVEQYQLIAATTNSGEEDNMAPGMGWRAIQFFGCVDRLRNAAVECWEQVRNWGGKVVKASVGKEVHDVVVRGTIAKSMLEQMIGMEDPDEPGSDLLAA